MTDLEDLQSFIEVVESGGFNRAAKRLAISKSIISRRIARLEKDLGVRLLARTTRGISPTEAGLEFKLRGERILADLAEAEDTIAQQGSAVVGRLRLSVPLTFGVRHVAPVLSELACRHPKLELDVSYSDKIVDLIGDRLDAAIRIGNLPDTSLIARRIAPVRAALVASSAYIARRGRPEKPSDLTEHECLIYTGQTNPFWQFKSGKRQVSVRPSGRLRSDNSEVLLQWAIAGLGITYLPSFLVADAIEDGSLVPILPALQAPEFGIYVVRPPGAHVPGKLRALIDALVARFGGEPDWDRCLLKAREEIRQRRG